MTKRYVFFIAISSFILTVIWIISNVYHSYATSTIEPLLQIQIEEIAPNFDEETISNLQNRTVIEPSDEAVFIPPTEEESQAATSEAVLTEPDDQEDFIEPIEDPLLEPDDQADFAEPIEDPLLEPEFSETPDESTVEEGATEE